MELYKINVVGFAALCCWCATRDNACLLRAVMHYIICCVTFFVRYVVSNTNV